MAGWALRSTSEGPQSHSRRNGAVRDIGVSREAITDYRLVKGPRYGPSWAGKDSQRHASGHKRPVKGPQRPPVAFRSRRVTLMDNLVRLLWTHEVLLRALFFLNRNMASIDPER